MLEHVAIIMDGNGRWAKKRMLPKAIGHSAGADALHKILLHAHKLGVKFITAYAFSTENWLRPQKEVNDLMNLMREYVTRCVKETKKNDLKIMHIGDISRLDNDLQEKILHLEDITKHKTGLCFVIALNYGGRDEIVRAVRKVCEHVHENEFDMNNLNEETFSAYLDTKSIPDPELLIRTSGEMRLSNFLLWQLAYTEFYYSTKLWPEFDENDFEAAVSDYMKRERRFGKRIVCNKEDLDCSNVL